MPKKSGQARVPELDEWERLYQEIAKHRHPIKNRAIMQVSQKLGLRVQEISLLEIKECAKLFGTPGSENRTFRLFELMSLPKNYTKGANALGRSKSKYVRRKVSFSISEFEKLVERIAQDAIDDRLKTPSDYYPAVNPNRDGVARDLPLVDPALRAALEDHIQERLNKNPYLKPSDPLFVSQKGGRYSPNTLQEHMALMLREWAGIEKATSHSGRRSLLTDVIHNQEQSIKVAQKIAGHKDASTTAIYDEPPEYKIKEALEDSYRDKKGV